MKCIISHYCVVIESSSSRTETAYLQCSLLYRVASLYENEDKFVTFSAS